VDAISNFKPQKYGMPFFAGYHPETEQRIESDTQEHVYRPGLARTAGNRAQQSGFNRKDQLIFTPVGFP
jgi:hypothetical protein